ncbi:hypothetical protein ANCDUO_07769 [Ancylostoma duodenale]|uniref:Uncharacterized protein n=1 Tax=Ancylostoma duodenale TaxID=51022 RepID=A0A0C2GL64_9BILA|nr:hypothetical protein ANCDUO_07769 [Ancylostoma duodenale]
MRAFIPLLLYCIALSHQDEESDKKKEDSPPLVRCPHVNPYKKLEDWLAYSQNNCNATTLESELNDEDKTYYKFGLKSFAYDIMASDRLGVRRELGSQAHQL